MRRALKGSSLTHPESPRYRDYRHQGPNGTYLTYYFLRQGRVRVGGRVASLPFPRHRRLIGYAARKCSETLLTGPAQATSWFIFRNRGRALHDWMLRVALFLLKLDQICGLILSLHNPQGPAQTLMVEELPRTGVVAERSNGPSYQSWTIHISCRSCRSFSGTSASSHLIGDARFASSSSHSLVRSGAVLCVEREARPR
jgi:hypothetical protein